MTYEHNRNLINATYFISFFWPFSLHLTYSILFYFIVYFVAYIGTSFMCATSAMLCAHHLFAVWNGDRRLKEKVKYTKLFRSVNQEKSFLVFSRF